MDKIKIESIKGNFADYAKLTAESGFCFYDKERKKNILMVEEYLWIFVFLLKRNQCLTLRLLA